MIKIYLSLFFICQANLAICQTVLTGKVIRIADGDTITILDADNTQIKVRLYGIDCPESHQDFGTVARKFTADHCFRKTVKVEVKDIDRYGRTVGVVMLSDSINLNKELLNAGLAWHYKYFDKSEDFANAEAQARDKKVGLWSMKNPIAPWEFRRAKQQNYEGTRL